MRSFWRPLLVLALIGAVATSTACIIRESRPGHGHYHNHGKHQKHKKHKKHKH